MIQNGEKLYRIIEFRIFREPLRNKQVLIKPDKLSTKITVRELKHAQFSVILYVHM
jgi:hypothetical protein